jgi:hypothetical protein
MTVHAFARRTAHSLSRHLGLPASTEPCGLSGRVTALQPKGSDPEDPRPLHGGAGLSDSVTGCDRMIRMRIVRAVGR